MCHPLRQLPQEATRWADSAVIIIPGSSSGRTPDSGSGNLGSNPSPGAKEKKTT